MGILATLLPNSYQMLDGYYMSAATRSLLASLNHRLAAVELQDIFSFCPASIPVSYTHLTLPTIPQV